MAEKKSIKDELEETKEDLADLEKYIEEFSTFLPLPVCTVNPVKRVIDANKAFEAMTHYGSAEIVGEFLGNIFLKKEKLEETLERAKLKKEIATDELVLISKQKKEILVRISASIRQDEFDNFIGYFVSITDITETKKFQGKLEEEVKARTKELDDSRKSLINILEDVEDERNKAEEEKEKTLALISSFSTPVIFLNSQNKLALFNPSAREILNIKDGDLDAEISENNNFSLNNFTGIIHNKFKVEKIEKGRGDIDEYANLEEVTVKYREGDRIYKVTTVKAKEKDGDYLGTVKIFYDTTREKTIDRLKSEFISIAAHQLRTPLSAIKWVIKMILDGDAGKLTVEQQELLSKGYASNERIIRLVNDLLNVSRIEEGKFGFDFQKENFQKVIDATLGNLENLIVKNHLQLEIKKPKRLPEVYFDKERMVMVMQNILDNAIKYTPEYGKIEIKIEVDKQFLYVKIKDQGVGIPKKDQEKLFTKFFRATNAVRLETEGSGLGLFIVKNIIERHNGKIILTSEEGKGTEVSFSLPLNKPQ
ncbi:MAG: ATP-binding protein [Patescibacteria group bacterium]|nr:ATP-binding protein [Patescibacteria group bacterium]